MVSQKDFAYLVGLKRNSETGEYVPWVYIVDEKSLVENYSCKITIEGKRLSHNQNKDLVPQPFPITDRENSINIKTMGAAAYQLGSTSSRTIIEVKQR